MGAMTLWLLYLFVSKLQSLIKNSLGSCRKNLRMTISYNVSQKELSRSTKKENSIRRQSKFSQTSNNNDKNDKNNEVMYDTVKATNDQYTVIYYVVVVCFGTFVILNLFVAILLSKMGSEESDE